MTTNDRAVSPTTRRLLTGAARRHIAHLLTIALGYTIGHVGGYHLTHHAPVPLHLRDGDGVVVPGDCAIVVDMRTGERLKFDSPVLLGILNGVPVKMPNGFLEQNS